MNHTRPEFSDAQILGAISAALRAGDMKAVVDLLHLLAVQSPRQAQLIVDAIELVVEVDRQPSVDSEPTP